MYVLLFDVMHKTESSSSFDHLTTTTTTEKDRKIHRIEWPHGQLLHILSHNRILQYDLEIPPMNIGGKRRLKIPPGLAYGEDGNGPIPPNQVLNFDIEVLNSEPIGGISMETRLKGYAVALTVPLVVLAIAWFALTHIQL